MPPKPEELPKLEDWKAPWEVDADGKDVPEDEQRIDKPRLKKYLHGLLGDKNRLRQTADTATAQAEELQQKVEKAKKPEEFEALQQELATARREAAEAKEKAKGSADALKWEVALDKGLTKTQAKRLVGTTREELEADADELLASWGHQGESDGGEGKGESGDGVRRTPRRNLRNGGDPDSDAGKGDDKEVDPDEYVKKFFANRR